VGKGGYTKDNGKEVKFYSCFAVLFIRLFDAFQANLMISEKELIGF